MINGVTSEGKNWLKLGTHLFGTLLLLLAVSFVPFSAQAKTSKIDKRVQDLWGKKRGIKVIQRRVFEKNKRWEFGLYVGSMPNDNAWNYWPVGARIDYFLFESLGIELVGAYVPSSKTKLFKFLSDTYSNVQTSKLEKVVYFAGFNGFWAPIHGKFSIFNAEVTHFDVGLNFGAGVIGTKTQDYSKNPWVWSTPGPYGEVGLGVQMYLTKSWALRFDYRHYFYPAAGGGMSMPAEFSIGFGWFTKAPQ